MMPSQPADRRWLLAKHSRRCYLAATRLTPADGRPHNCLGALLGLGGTPTTMSAAFHYALAIGAASGEQARRNGRANLVGMLEKLSKRATVAPTKQSGATGGSTSALWAAEALAAALFTAFARVDGEEPTARRPPP